MDLKDILDALREYGFSGTIIGFVILCLWLIAKSTWFSNVMSKISDGIFDKFSKKSTESSIKVINESDVLNHDIFNYIDFWMYSRVPTFQFSTDYRTAVFRKYLTIFLKKHKENIRKYVDNKNFEKMEDSELWTSLLSLINDIIYDYEKEMELAGIPKVIIEKMKVKNNDTISLTIDLIEGICNSQFYSSDKNLLKIY